MNINVVYFFIYYNLLLTFISIFIILINIFIVIYYILFIAANYAGHKTGIPVKL